MDTNVKIETDDVCESNIKHRNLIGALLHVSSATRPDISYSVNYLSRFQNCYNETRYKYALRILKYLYVTKDLKLEYKKNEKVETLDCYVDSDWPRDINDRKSTIRYVIRLCGNVIHWKSEKQKCVTKDPTFAEYTALSEAVYELIFIREVLRTFNVRIDKSIKIYKDNSGTINSEIWKFYEKFKTYRNSLSLYT
jgi:hypothetical protein